MPAKTRTNRKRNNRNKAAKSSIVGFQTPKCIFPDSMSGWCTYAVTVIATIPSSSLSGYVFRLNSIFDPDYSSVSGRSCGAYAQMAALYSRYRVLRARVHVDVPPMSLATEGVFGRSSFMVAASTDVTLGTTPDQWLAQRHVYQRAIGTNTVSHTFDIPIAAVFGVPASVVQSSDDFSATFGANPANVVYLHTAPYNLTGVSAASNYTVRIEFFTRFEKPIYLG